MSTAGKRKRGVGDCDSSANHKRQQRGLPISVSEGKLDRPNLDDLERDFSEAYEEHYCDQIAREDEERFEKSKYMEHPDWQNGPFTWKTAELLKDKTTRFESYQDFLQELYSGKLSVERSSEHYFKVEDMILQSFEQHEEKFLKTGSSKKRNVMHQQELITLRQEILSLMQDWQTNEEAALMPNKKVANFEPTTLPKVNDTHESKQANDDKVTLSEPTSEQNHYEQLSSGQLGVQAGGEQPKVKMKQFENPHFLSIIKHDSLGGYKADAAHCNVGCCVDKKPKLKQKSVGCFDEKQSNKQKKALLNKSQRGATQRVSDSTGAHSSKEVRRATAVASASGTSMAGVRNADAEHGDGRGDVDKKPKFKQRLAMLCSPLRTQQW